MELPSARIVGRLVEYHSEPTDHAGSSGDTDGPLTGLCPPPRSLAGEAGSGTVSCIGRDGRLVHRHANFVPLIPADSPTDAQIPRAKKQFTASLLVLLASQDLSPNELSAELSEEPDADALHRAIRQFRRAQSHRYRVESLLGNSSAMAKIRSQVTFASSSDANVLICGRPGAGGLHVARAIHYFTSDDAFVKLVPIDAAIATEDSLRRAIDAVGGASIDAQRPALLIERIDRLSASHQSLLADVVRRGRLSARLLATQSNSPEPANHDLENTPPQLDPALRDLVSTITIHLPRLVERIEDLPVLAQFFLEQANRDNPKQVGSLRPESLDLLALYSWPGELDELREVIVAAHSAATSTAIQTVDLPAVIHHAAKAAAIPVRSRERIVLDDLLADIEKEAITRALAQAAGNKTEAAELLGLTRPRLYRRMQQLGLIATDSLPRFTPRADDDELQMPDFREIEPEEPAS